MGRWLLKGDFIFFLQWWLAIFILGIIFMPTASVLFKSFHDKGYIFSKTLGIGVAGFIMWLAASFHIMKFNTASVILSVVFAAIMNAVLLIFLLRKRKDRSDPQSRKPLSGGFTEKALGSMITEELLFFGLFLFFLYIRGFKPEAYGTEKFMDYGFMTTMMRSEYMPPRDLWFSGTSINYYYVGQYIATFLTRLCFVKVSSGYNLMLMMTGAFAVLLPYSIVFNLISRLLSDRGKKSSWLPGLSGLIGGAAVCVAGNMHYPIYAWLMPRLQKLRGLKEPKKYWFPDATRYIGYNPETHDKTIHEFPSYSFILGDLHAHVINLLFVLTLLGILLAWLFTRERFEDDHPPIWKEIFQPAMFALAFLIGLFHMTNFWDFPIYFVVSGAIILFSNMVVYNFKRRALVITGLQGVFIFALSWLVCLPFTLKFDQISTSVCWAVAHTPLYQLLVLWGLPISMVLGFLIFLIAGYQRKNKKEGLSQEEKRKGPVYRFMESLGAPDLFVLTIGLCAIGLILLPEIVYVQDIYSGDYKRANTMFKLTYQAYIMFGISFGYLFIRLLRFGETVWQRVYTMIGLILFTCTLFYAGNAVKAWFGNIFDTSGYKGLDASAFMEKEMPDDYPAIQWLNENVDGLPVTLEAPGDSYTDYERVSVMTGLPTLLGWHTHEWLWKSDVSLLDERTEDIQTIYTSEDEALVRDLIKQYHIEYIYVGRLEKEKYTKVNDELLKGLGEVVYDSQESTAKAYETYIVRIGTNR